MIIGRSTLELWNRILESLIKVGCPSRFKSFLSDFLTGRKPLLLWSFYRPAVLTLYTTFDANIYFDRDFFHSFKHGSSCVPMETTAWLNLLSWRFPTFTQRSGGPCWYSSTFENGVKSIALGKLDDLKMDHGSRFLNFGTAVQQMQTMTTKWW